MVTLPAKPASVIAWEKNVKAAHKHQRAMYDAGLATDADLIAIKPLVPMSPQVEQDYTAWAKEYNAAVRVYNAQARRERAAQAARAAKLEAERQARKNAAETAKVRSAACPRCFSTHPGEC